VVVVVVVVLVLLVMMALYALRGGVSGLRIERITLWNLCFNSTGLGPWASGGGLAAITLAGYGCQVFCVRERDRRTGGRGQASDDGRGGLFVLKRVKNMFFDRFTGLVGVFDRR
jgi:hypothetical protein